MKECLLKYIYNIRRHHSKVLKENSKLQLENTELQKEITFLNRKNDDAHLFCWREKNVLKNEIENLKKQISVQTEITAKLILINQELSK